MSKENARYKKINVAIKHRSAATSMPAHGCVDSAGIAVTAVMASFFKLTKITTCKKIINCNTGKIIKCTKRR
jgi:hypothetical protein